MIRPSNLAVCVDRRDGTVGEGGRLHGVCFMQRSTTHARYLPGNTQRQGYLWRIIRKEVDPATSTDLYSRRIPIVGCALLMAPVVTNHAPMRR